MIPLLPSAWARSISAALATCRMRSEFSSNSLLKRTRFRIVSVKFSHTEIVQLAALTPPSRISAKSSRLQLEMRAPSIARSPPARSECLFMLVDRPGEEEPLGQHDELEQGDAHQRQDDERAKR